MALFVFELFYVAPLALGGTAGAAVTLFESILTHQLDAFIFFLRGEVGHEVFDELGPYPVAEGLTHLDDAVELLDGDFVDFACLDFVRGLE